MGRKNFPECLMTSNLTSVILSAVPFDEDEKDPSVWFLDHDYLENMYGMFKKVNGMCSKGHVYHKSSINPPPPPHPLC